MPSIDAHRRSFHMLKNHAPTKIYEKLMKINVKLKKEIILIYGYIFAELRKFRHKNLSFWDIVRKFVGKRNSAKRYI